MFSYIPYKDEHGEAKSQQEMDRILSTDRMTELLMRAIYNPTNSKSFVENGLRFIIESVAQFSCRRD